ncbi:MAG: RNA-binding protein [uncultured bacterium (gcode 4)]|uniref:RNA-binding protein n=1 Tax=uncultured bacterium (gcode 4) TaxID=1234023 RepID=K2FTR9_9BACT|nr:MAG: RNA-binding protein [uncultured bacterium (gcode 4)]
MREKINDLCLRFFTLSWVQIDSLTVDIEDEGKNIYFIKLETPDSKLIIWTHGQTLEIIKHLLSRMIENLIWRNFTIHLEVNDYLKSKDEKLFRYIDWRIDYVTKNNKSISLPDFSAYERKKIHHYISEKNIEWLKTFSEWDWKERVMHMTYSKPSSKSIDIDIDWIDI